MNFCDRDEKGWRIPREYTTAWHIYDLLKRNYSMRQIHNQFFPELTRNCVRVMIWKIKNPELANKYTRRKAHEKEAQERLDNRPQQVP